MVNGLLGPHGGTTLAALTLAEPLWLGGLAAVAWPLWLHLRNARPGPPMWFPSIRLIEQAERQANRRDRWTDRLLLAMRCALIGLIALLFARPAWVGGTPDQPSDTAAVSPTPRTASAVTLIVLDRTASMQVADAARSRFDRARQIAQNLIADLPAAHRAMIIAAGLQPELLLPMPTRNGAALTRALDGLSPTAGHTPLVDGVRHGLDALPDHNALTTVHLLTDRQRAAVEGLDELALPDDVTVRVHPVGMAMPNVALRAPRVEPRSPVVGQAARLSVEVANYGPEPITTPVYLRGVAGAASPRLTIPAGERRPWTIPLRFASTGWRTVTLALPGDALPLDDRIDLPVHVRPPVNVAVVSITPDATTTTGPTGSHAAFYLVRAVAPDDAGRYRVHRLDLDQLAATDPLGQANEPNVLLLVGEGELSSGASDAILQRVRDGAGLVVLSSNLDFGDSAAMPIEQTATQSHTPGLGLTGLVSDQPPWRAFTGEALTTLLDVRFGHTAEVVAADRATVSARWSDGGPALATTSLGRGRVAWLTASIAPAHTDLVRSPAFAPLIHELIALVEPAGRSSSVTRPGQPLRIPVAEIGDPAAVVIEGPSGERLPFVTRSANDRTVLELETATEVGLHTATASGNLVGGAVVLLDPRESDLTVRRPELAERGNRATDAAPVSPPDSSTAAATDDVAPRFVSLWPYVAGVVVLLALIELVAASIRRQSDASATPDLRGELPPLRGHGEAA